MEIENIDLFKGITETLTRLNDPGALLVAGVQRPNVMTIGWATIGIIWGMPICVIYVRPSRFTHSLLEKHAEFTVNIPTVEQAAEVMVCGTKSGREMDKFAECKFTLEPGKKIDVGHIKECPIYYECRTVHKNAVVPDGLPHNVRQTYYASGDYHDIYYGEILGVFRNE